MLIFGKHSTSHNKFTDGPFWVAAWNIVPLALNSPISWAINVGVQHSTVFPVSTAMDRIIRLISAPVGEVGPLTRGPNPISFLCCIAESNPRRYFCHVEAYSFVVKFLIFLLCLNLDKVAVQVLTGLPGTCPVNQAD